MIKNILTNLKIEQLNAMQEAAIDTWKEGKDLILLSPTGSGKTLAYLLPLLQSLKPDVKGVQAIVLVPSRELALQIDQVFKSMNTPFKAVSCYGGRPAMEEHRTIKGVQPSVVIGTPGRMNDHLSKQNIDAETVTTLVIDEFDKCLEFGFQEEMATVIGQLPRLKRRFLLSATDAEEIPQFTGLNKTIKLNFLNTEEQTVQRLHLYKVLSPGKSTISDLTAAKMDAATNTITTTNNALTASKALDQLKDGDTVTIKADAAQTATVYTYNASAGNFSFSNVSNNTSAKAGDVAASLLPPAGQTASGVYKAASGEVNFDVDANGKITIGGQEAYLTSDGNLTTNDAGGATAATLDGLFKKAGDGQSIGFNKTASVTMGGTTYNFKTGADAGAATANAGVSFTDTASKETVLNKVATAKQGTAVAANGDTSATITLPLLASIEYFVVYEPIVVISPSASVYVAVALETSVLSAYFALAVPSPAANTA